ncbi:longevity assurance proteins LAG1/LAC1 [Rhypophila decipiens]|uniref:Longevity assurance proteins LAG1/LAC1 n=1 Tax=Rhypophila decipiens TaxID=261697 RepID=A0AAN6YEW6_9PEZI|nr:longevity assurance proteins LAG1/LAC1 [Rhypophila decipiens]
MADDPPTQTPDRGQNDVKQDDAPATAPTPQTTVSRPQPARKPSKRSYSGKKETMNGPLYMQASNNVVIVRRLKRNGEGAIKQLTRWFVENQIGFSFNLLALLFLAHGIPRARTHTIKYFTLSYQNPQSGLYGIGWDDTYLTAFCVMLFTLLRASVMEYVLAPFAKSQGVSKRKDITRFSEQAWLLMYYTVFWSMGVYIYVNSPHYLNLHELWTSWPVREISGLMKGYMLAQLAFWVQQILVINIEERRKDHWQMFAHHIVTNALIFASYRYGHTRVGNLILVLMDVVDLFFPAAKCLKYLGYNTLCDVMFGLFMVSWFIARHVLYVYVCWSVYAHTPDIMPTGCFSGPDTNRSGPLEAPTTKGSWYLLEPLWDSEGLVCYDEKVKWIFLSMLLFLQALTIMWFTLIVQLAIKVLRGGSAEDPRSDDEGEDLEDEDEYVYEEAQPLEEEVGVEALDLKNWERRTGVKRQATTATGVSLPGHSDRKELLGRIGCEKQVD